MSIEWNSDLETEDPLINSQHQDLFKRNNELFESIKQLSKLDEESDEVGEMLRFLTHYTIEHFKDEEELMLRNKYEKYEEHIEIHHEFIKLIEIEVKNYEEYGPDLPALMKLNKLVSKWLTDHIMNVDIKMIKSFKDLNQKTH